MRATSRPAPNDLRRGTATLGRLIYEAWQAPFTPASTGGPAWVATQEYDVEAKAAHPVKRGRNCGLMLRNLLADPF